MTAPFYSDEWVTLYHGDCLDVIAGLPDASVHAVITDPPYGLGFMGKEWDALPPGKQWAEECLRVLKPGGHLLAFGGTRTWHRLTVAVEDAGFEIRDSIAYLYGSGFPKSRNIGNGLGTALKPAFEPVVVARKPLAGTVAGNVLAHGVGALNIDASRIGTDVVTQHGRGDSENTSMSGRNYAEAPGRSWAGRWPANVILDESQAAALDEQSGNLPTQAHREDPERRAEGGMFGLAAGGRRSNPGAGEMGGASRFFYTAKADQSERITHNGIAHPTVKPLDLMRWLVRLVTPPGGTILEPFAGSGTTVEAAILEGFRCIAIEREADYLPLITQRIHRRRDPVKYLTAAGDDLGLFTDFGEAS